MKKKKSANELIQHMKSKGMTFNYTSEEDAKHFLSEHNYYLKFSSYRKNYEKYSRGPKKGQYLGLDFNHLKDLSTIDMHLRYQIMHMCLDIEHGIRVLLIHDIESNNAEDGYAISESFMANNTDLEKNLNSRKTSYCSRLMNKYRSNYPVWVLCELLSFSELVYLYQHYLNHYPDRGLPHPHPLYSVRNMRNAAAHNNCLINDLHAKVSTDSFKPSEKIRKFLLDNFEFGSDAINNKISNQMIHDFIALLIAYGNFVDSEYIRENRYKDMRSLFDGRMLEHADYYSQNHLIKSTYSFIREVLSYFD